MAPGSALWRTTPFRLALQFGAAYGLGIAILLGLVYLQTANYLTLRVDAILAREAAVFGQGGPEDALPRLIHEGRRDPLNHFALYSSSGQKVAGDIDLSPSRLPTAGAVRELGGQGDTPSLRAKAVTLPWGETLIVARDSGQLVELRRVLIVALMVSGATVAALGLAAGFILSRESLRRIQTMRQASLRIVAGDLTFRLPISRRGDELDALAAIVNDMLAEVERLLVHAESAGESIAHELRTPLTRLRAVLEHAAEANPPNHPDRERLEACVAEADSMLARFRALLRIAAVEATRRNAAITPLDLSGLVEQAAELYAPLIAERGRVFMVDIAPGIFARVDSDLFLEAIANLLDNALKFTPTGGSIGLSLTPSPRGFAVEVSDSGPGIPAAERPMVTKRFYRSAVHHGIPGHGLGLSLVAAVAGMHGLALQIADNAPGARVRLASAQASRA